MKKALCIILFGMYSTISAMEPVTLSDPETLKQQLRQRGVPATTIEVIQLHTHFGNKKMDPSLIAAEYDTFLSGYVDKAETPERKQFIISHIQQHKPTALAALLHNHPAALTATLAQLKQ